MHKNAEEGLGVISILFEEGGENPFLSKFWSPLPRKVGEVPSNLKINISEVFPGDPHFYYYDGSLIRKWFNPSVLGRGEVVRNEGDRPSF